MRSSCTVTSCGVPSTVTAEKKSKRAPPCRNARGRQAAAAPRGPAQRSAPGRRDRRGPPPAAARPASSSAAADRLAVHAKDQRLRHRLPVLDQRPQPVRMEHQAQHVAARRGGVRPSSSSAKKRDAARWSARCPSCRFMTTAGNGSCCRRIASIAARTGARSGASSARLAEHRREAGREQQGVALAQRDVQRVGQEQHHLAARLRAAGLEEAHVSRRDARLVRERELAQVPGPPPGLSSAPSAGAAERAEAGAGAIGAIMPSTAAGSGPASTGASFLDDRVVKRAPAPWCPHHVPGQSRRPTSPAQFPRR